MERAKSVYLSASGIVWTGPGFLVSMLIGADAVNDPQITVFDNVAGSGTELVPTTIYDASALGLNGFTLSFKKEFHTGCYVLIEASGGGAFGGAVELTLDIIGG